jgi:dTDP-glucose 4,6-dehydratase
MSVLITGGAGFIGSHLVRHAIETLPDASVVNLDALTYAGNLDNLADIADHPRYQFIHGDITDEALVARLMRETDVVIHAAAQTHVDRSIDGPAIFTHTNVWGTQVLLEAARKAQIAKFVLVSTDEVYGSVAPPGQFKETDPLDPSSPYSASKAASDLLALSYYKTYGFPVCITRCSNNYGPYQYPEKLIPLFILNAMANQAVPVYGDGLNVRDWIHVTDHSRAVFRVAEAGQPGEIYNIGTQNEQTNLAITQRILSHLGKSDRLITYVADRPGHDRRYAIDSHKLQSRLDWHPQVPFDEGLAETISWYQSNPTWLARLKARQASATAVAP